VRFDEPLARHTSFRVGGPADAFARPASREELATLCAIARAHGAPLVLLGGGFNALAPDAGVRGVVVQLRALAALELAGPLEVRAEAGVTHGRAVRFCADHALAGLEFAVGIPGTVGGWLAMNAGVPEREMKDVVREIEWLVEREGMAAGEAFMKVRSRLEEKRPFLYVPRSPSSGRHALPSPLELAGESDCLLGAPECEIGGAEDPVRSRAEGAAAHAGIVAAVERGVRAVLVAIVERDRRFEVRAGRAELADAPERRAEHVMSLHHEAGVGLAL